MRSLKQSRLQAVDTRVGHRAQQALRAPGLQAQALALEHGSFAAGRVIADSVVSGRQKVKWTVAFNVVALHYYRQHGQDGEDRYSKRFWTNDSLAIHTHSTESSTDISNTSALLMRSAVA